MSNELYLATTVDGIEIKVEVYEGATDGRRARARWLHSAESKPRPPVRQRRTGRRPHPANRPASARLRA